VDPGGKRIGVAIGDDDTGLVIPVGVHAHHGIETTAQLLILEAKRREADLIILGLPTSEDGTQCPACRRTRALAETLKEHGVHVVLQEEYLSTREARTRALEIGRPRGAPVDDLAAQIILEDFFGRRPTAPHFRP